MSDLSNVKVGDSVMVRIGTASASQPIKVTTASKTRFKCSGMEFRIKDGTQVGASKWDFTRATGIATPADIAEWNEYVRYEKALQAVVSNDRNDWRTLTLDQLTTIAKWLEEAKGTP